MSSRSPAVFIADAPGLDFLNSIFTPVDVPIDAIGGGEGLLAWLKESGMVPAKTIEQFRANAMPGELDGVAAQARSLREWFRTFVMERKGRPLISADLNGLEPLNRLLARDEAYKAVVVHDRGDSARFELNSNRRWRAPESLLLPIGVSLARFVCEEDFTHVKSCEGKNCTLVFVDHTRGHQRRWCSMAMCGNRAKQAAHRSRHKNNAQQ
jgi:predicted RNA-binding Zn ribbon-like protein